MKIGKLEIRGRVMQAPMAGCTDLAFRLVAREHGMELAFLEMVSSEALVRQNSKTLDLMKRTPKDSPLGAQIFGQNPRVMGEAAAIVDGMGFDVIDINMGCPVPKVVSPGAGSALMADAAKAEAIFKAVVKKARRAPVSVKMRTGFKDRTGSEAEHIAKIAENSGIAMITVHGRTRSQGYGGKADWAAIGRVKKAVNIPVVGNGDITTGKEAVSAIQASGCDGLMIGRGALGNPWIYREIEDALDGKIGAAGPTREELQRTLLRHMDLLMEFEGEKRGVLKMRRIAAWYFTCIPGVVEFRKKINGCRSSAEMRRLVEEFASPADFRPPPAI